APLQGQNLYAVTFPAGPVPPGKGLWALTLYNAQHFFHPSPLNRYSLGTKRTSLKKNPDISLHLHAVATPPDKEKENNWPPGSRRHILPLHSRVLARAGDPRRPVDAANHTESAKIE